VSLYSVSPGQHPAAADRSAPDRAAVPGESRRVPA